MLALLKMIQNFISFFSINSILFLFLQILLIVLLWKPQRIIAIGILICLALELIIAATLIYFSWNLGINKHPTAPTPIITNVLPDVSWVKDPVNIFYTHNNELYSFDLLTQEKIKIFSPLDYFILSPNGQRILATYTTERFYDSYADKGILTIFNLRNNTIEFQKNLRIGNIKHLSFLDNQTLMVGLPNKILILDVLKTSEQELSIPGEIDYYNEIYSKKNKNIVFLKSELLRDGNHHYKAYEYNIKSKSLRECLLYDKNRYCLYPEERMVTGRGYWNSGRLYSPDSQRASRSCIDGDVEKKALCQELDNYRQEVLVNCKDCKGYYLKPEAWSIHSQYLLFSGVENIYLYDFKTKKAGYLFNEGNNFQFHDNEKKNDKK